MVIVDIVMMPQVPEMTWWQAPMIRRLAAETLKKNHFSFPVSLSVKPLQGLPHS